MSKTKVVIVGGGFGGVYAARSLLRSGYDVTLISRTNFFIFTPLLHEVATGALNASDITFEYSDFFHNTDFTFYRENVRETDFESHKVVTSDGEEIFYDYLIVSTGAKTNFFGTKGEENALELKTIEDANEIKRRIIKKAQGIERNVSVNVIGGGPTGSELVFEIKEFLETIKKYSSSLEYSVRLIHADKNLCPNFPMSVQDYTLATMKRVGIDIRLETFVTEITPEGVITKEGEKIDGDLNIWTAGVSPNTEIVGESFKDEKGNVIVDDNLRVAGREREFAIGDVMTREGEVIPKLAQTAIRQGKGVAKNIKLHNQGKEMTRYEVKLKGILLSLGKGRGAGKLFGFDVKGFFGWMVWKGAYLTKVPGFRNKVEVFSTWTINLFSSRDLYEK
ncbi:MAG: NAD(P)/FAD-dependent oxidoreductase [Candidatus Campbellbacteria bacterium]|nr:NAD(P)/FAD-dependent oxidoreductase [Candidatus Campbellbacteria bacterium]